MHTEWDEFLVLWCSDDGHTRTTYTPVVPFTTREGTVVTAHCMSPFADPADAYGRHVTIHHTPTDPTDYTLDRAAEQRSDGHGVTLNVLVTVVLAATAVTGVVFL
ncbi:DUF3592 domain-containing protein [Micromonospora sp. CPCC 205539]|uniref:DUF3592 domain-containing protein n=1 Tax=Micromonospora sp. CPCC 205539 TaxID=3122408 RepID=UPI002FEFAFD2